MKNNNYNFVFFGTPILSVWVLEELKKKGVVPSILVTAPDAPSGRNLKLTPSPVKVWGSENNIPVYEVETFRKKPTPEFLLKTKWDFFVVAAYNFILPKSILDLPLKGTLNVHPSLLPEMRGPSPVRSSILLDKKNAVGVSIILLDEEVDHGPIITQKEMELETWPIKGRILDELLFRKGGKILGDVIPEWLKNKMTPKEQNHSLATFSKKFKKEDGLVDLNDDGYQNYLKYCAFDGWPRVYYFDQNGKRIIITDAELNDNKFIIKRIIPEGEKERDYK